MVVVGDAEERKQESEKGRKKGDRGYVFVRFDQC